MDKLQALSMFVETVRCGGYSAAARKLGVATSSVTRQVAALEAELGTTLLNRTTRHSSPTVVGQDYYDKAVAILDALAEADGAVFDRGSEARGRLRVSVPVEFGRRGIAPHLGRLLARHPELDISLHLSDQMTDMAKERIDLCVRLGSTLATDDIVSKPIGRFQRWVVASPGYLARGAIPLHPLDVLEHACLVFDYGPSLQNWVFREGGDSIAVNVHGRLYSNNADVLREAALADGGLALLADWLVDEDVRQGRLVRVLAGFEASPGSASCSINVLYLPGHRESSRIRAFVAFLEEILD
ncbi:LysR family transcriptional regulator [Pseudomonas sp. 148P]|uniref:LysR family transcriptional regulator n=1 Tax=Pseudomonas ulcerans TaxID=3115852 RepID=A0ABU7HN36_9PSED|nr:MULTISPECIES: LysR family transcriptional regulator [unclassified Pseudomonas]MEE1922472.1 LysR family transcriptional regulator [Pseudomonas sp. 147P]MEE1932946.1 LysR family transcriptional regulator [Pseudomonas sp. 148P]